MLLCITFHFNIIVRLVMHTATYYMNMYGYMYIVYYVWFVNADACMKRVSIEAKSQYLKLSKHASTCRLRDKCI